MMKYLKVAASFLAVAIFLLSAYMVVFGSRDKELAIANSQRFSAGGAGRSLSLGDYSSSHD